ncbi:hypothetical protein ACFLU5_00835 [Bacteroidota bacterium]
MEKSNQYRPELPNWKIRWGNNSKLPAFEDRYFTGFNCNGEMSEADILKNFEILVKLFLER